MKARDTRLVVCAAIRNNAGIIVCGPRHGDCLNAAVKYGIDPLPDSEHWECGTIYAPEYRKGKCLWENATKKVDLKKHKD